MKKRMQRIAGIVGGIAIAAGGVGMVVGQVQGDGFKPANMQDRNLKSNQIIFPGEETALDDQGSDDSDLWQQDKDSQDKLKPEDRPDTQHLFETTLVANAGTLPPNVEQNMQNTNGSVPVYQLDGTSGGGTGLLLPSGTNTGVGVQLPSGGNTATNTNNSGSQNGNNGNNSNNGSGSDNNHSGTNNNNSTTPSQDDNKPIKRPDMDNTRPELPDDDYAFESTFHNVVPFPSGGISSNTGSQDEPVDLSRYSLRFLPINNASDASKELYMGEYLDDWRLLCAVCIYVFDDVTNTPVYRLTEYNDLFKVGDYPETVEENKLSVNFYFRPNTDCEWQEYTYDYNILYDAKVLVGDWQENKYVAQEMYEEKQGGISVKESRGKP